jgi:hypothetical protein
VADGNKERLDQEAKAKQQAALDWPIEERGDPPGQWYRDMARAEFPSLSVEEQAIITDRNRGHDWLARMKAQGRVQG